MLHLTQANRSIDIPDLNRFQIGDHVIVDASAENDRFEGVIVGLEMQRVYGSNYFVPSITLLHGGYLTDGFKPIDCRKVDAPAPSTREVGSEDLRKRVMRAIFDPGETVGAKGDRDLTTWQTDAVMNVLSKTEQAP